jgi:nucleotide-binding universal stress UspA family protein
VPRAIRKARTRFRKILHPTDFSAASAPALTLAADLAREHGAELVLMHVIPPRGLAPGKDYMTAGTYQAVSRRAAQAELDARVARLARAGVPARAVVAAGIPHAQILHLAERDRVDLVVLGTHGRSGLSRFFLGSVATRVVQLAACPVLTVRAS